VSYETVELTRSDGIATLVLDRPQAMNAWDAQLAEELRDAIAEVAADDDVRVLLLTGRGRAFSAGADVKAGFPATAAGHWDVHTRLIEVHDPIILGLREMPKPAIAVVRGAAAGIGCSLALACDLVLAAESAYFLLAFINIGLAPDGGASAFVSARAGVGRATEMALLGEPVPASRAVEWGLANRAVPDDQLDEEALALARRLAAGPTKAYAAAKREFNAWAYSSLRAQLALEADEQQRLAATHDNAEGVAAFLEKRQAGFLGR
jgi:2-(1,2-epoxy-1,2-dihydrophenyl)acetyl-CoA isomerase